MEISEAILDNPVVGYGLTSWAVRVDAVAKCYTSRDAASRERELLVYQRLASGYSDPHPCIIPFYGVLDASLLLQFQPNGSIRQYRAANPGRISLSTLLRWAEQAARAVDYLHSKGIFHGDISCNNILLDAELNAKIGNFAGSSVDGLSFLTVHETSHALPGTTTVSVRREIFALGSMLYELMTGFTPFAGKEPHEIEELFAREQFPPVDDIPVLGPTILRAVGYSNGKLPSGIG